MPLQVDGHAGVRRTGALRPLLADADTATFRELADRWILEFAELYAASG